MRAATELPGGGRELARCAEGMARSRARLAKTTLDEAPLRVLLVCAHEIFRRRHEVLAGPVAALRVEAKVRAAGEARSRADEVVRYAKLVPRICEAADRVLPPNADVLVVSRGDDALLELGGRRAAHFPQTDSGVWAGFYPPDSEAAVSHLKTLCRGGAQYLLLPSTAYWWLDYYDGLARYLGARSRVVFRSADCAIFDLRPSWREGARSG